MGQLFQPGANATARFIIGGVVLGLVIVFYVGIQLNRSDYTRGEREMVEQPVQFSHRHHVAELGIDCRYCHSSVQTSPSAGMPPTQTCMTCHSQIWTESPMLRPVRRSYAENKPLQWNRVHDLPDFVYFDHSIHVNKGVGCETCHGRVDQMPLVYQTESLEMQWCLDCHRQPEQFLRPRSEVFTFGYQPDGDQRALGQKLIEAYNIPTEQLDNCYTCHR